MTSGTQVFVSGGIRLVEHGHLSIMPKLLFYNHKNLLNFRIGADFNYAIYQRYNRKPRNTNSINFAVNFQIDKGTQFALQYLQPKYIVGMAYHIDSNFRTENNVYNNAVEVMILVRNPIAPKYRRRGKINGLKRIKQPKQKKRKESPKENDLEKPLLAESNVEVNETPPKAEPSDSTKIADPILTEEDKPMQIELDKWRSSVGLGPENQLNFEFNSTEVSQDSYNTLVQLAELLQEYESATLIITGYTDDIGSAKINHAFSVRRAQAVQEILVDFGVPRERIIIQGKGEEDPIAENKTSEGRQKNRRVDFVIIE
jgi:outer membrane protein OmpA-like peptidoglycan-associated protein